MITDVITTTKAGIDLIKEAKALITPQLTINQYNEGERAFIIIKNDGSITINNIKISKVDSYDIANPLELYSIDVLEPGEERKLQIGLLSRRLISTLHPSFTLDIRGKYKIGGVEKDLQCDKKKIIF